MSGAPIGEETLFDAIGPGDGLQHADLEGQAGEGGIEFGDQGFVHGGGPGSVFLEG